MKKKKKDYIYVDFSLLQQETKTPPYFPGAFGEQSFQAAIQPAEKRPEKQLDFSQQLIGRMLRLKPLYGCVLNMSADHHIG